MRKDSKLNAFPELPPFLPVIGFTVGDVGEVSAREKAYAVLGPLLLEVSPLVAGLFVLFLKSQ